MQIGCESSLPSITLQPHSLNKGPRSSVHLTVPLVLLVPLSLVTLAFSPLLPTLLYVCYVPLLMMGYYRISTLILHCTSDVLAPTVHVCSVQSSW